MQKQLKQKWVEALRSGKYEQTDGYLCNNGKFCCLGVLCDVINSEKWKPSDERTHKEYMGTFDLLPKTIKKRISSDPDKAEDIESHLVEMNDGKMWRSENPIPPATFTEIADWIEENV